jgi:hypothetical protein
MEAAMKLAAKLINFLSGGTAAPADTTGPACAITSAATNPTATSPFSVTITFTNPDTETAEAVTGFTVGDITASGFTLTDFTEVSDGVYTVNAAFTGGSGTLDVGAGVCTDASGNNNTAATQFSRNYLYSFSQQPSTTGQDTYILASSADTNFNGGSLSIRSARRNLIKFDLSSIPASSTIQSATLTVTLFTASISTDVHLSSNRILIANNSWTEAAATWNYQDGAGGGHRWAGDTGADGGADAGCSVSGTDHSATVLGTGTIPNGSVAGYACAITLNASEMQLMLANNAGIVLTGDAGSGWSCADSENATAGYRPKLDITYINP